MLALIARDRGCVDPRCTRGPSWTQAHHLPEWDADDGPTDLVNLALLGWEHHTRLHRRREHLHPPVRPGAPWTIKPYPPTLELLRRAFAPS